MTTSHTLIPDSTAPLTPPLKALAGALVLAILVLHLGFLTRHSLWNNEFITLQSIELPYGEMIRERVEHNHAPGYFIMLKAWSGVAGDGEAALRFPSAVLSLLGIAVIWGLARELFGPRWALLALAFAGLNQAPLELSTDARMYSWLYLASGATLWALIHYLERGGKPALGALAAAGVFGISAHLLYLLVTAGMVVFLIAGWRRDPARHRAALFAALAPVLLLLPLILWWAEVQEKVGDARSLTSFKFTNAYRQVIHLMLGDYYGPFARPGSRIAVLLLILSFVLTIPPLARRLSARRILHTSPEASPGAPPAAALPGRITALLWIWILLPMFSIAIAEMFSKARMTGAWRYFVTVGPAATLLLVAATRHFALGLGRGAAAVLAALALFVIVNNSAGFLIWPGTGIREVLTRLKDERLPGDLVIASKDKNRSWAFRYYEVMDHLPHERPFGATQPDKVLEWLQPLCAGHDRLWVVFYQKEKKDKVWKTMDAYPEFFHLQGEVYRVGDNAIGLYLIDDAIRGGAPEPGA